MKVCRFCRERKEPASPGSSSRQNKLPLPLAALDGTAGFLAGSGYSIKLKGEGG